jgi:hypothetical protein
MKELPSPFKVVASPNQGVHRGDNAGLDNAFSFMVFVGRAIRLMDFF